MSKRQYTFLKTISRTQKTSNFQLFKLSLVMTGKIKCGTSTSTRSSLFLFVILRRISSLLIWNLYLKKEIDGEKDNWWAFNAKQIILREKLFDWNAGGLLSYFREKRAEVLKDTKKQHGKNLLIVLISNIALLKNFEKKIARRQKTVDDKVRKCSLLHHLIVSRKITQRRRKRRKQRGREL